ncbi:AidB family quorum-quenching N-acyl homoserine lactonase [Allorhizobium borbori]|uniref:Glyoxylase-like metal-dependent hydrolase (Beta-lactamase superfamily II) n=1 Tax=Allorhizobium borbori TaxID=485907 RepID=A0A7W6P003_9HYPH|nr:MBL fold metallo-hydrolase [Allorhizobium borbori]MBB4101933.1 glyoxylase-like metal-dependent hydrolase (beta-lactamase superfamily II) [Allorhizobium borbori]
MTEARRFGPYEITTFIDGVYRAPIEHLAHATNAAVRDAAVAAWSGPTVDMDVNFFALSGPDGITLVDAGTGPFWGPELGLGRAALAAAGIEPGDVRRVLLTHLHGDHALGLFGEAGRFFPDADIFAPEPDLAFFSDAAVKETVPSYRRGGFDIAARLVATYGDRVKPISEGPVLRGIEAISMPGHTPGHFGYLIGEGAERLVLWGDLVHAPAFQLDDPDFCFVYDADPAQGAASRRSIFERAHREGWVASGGHVSGFVRVEKAGKGWRFVAA